MFNGTSTVLAERGRLKIYLGFAPGVGKTFTMLREALYLKNQHYDVVIGWLDENSREDILKNAGQLEAVPPREIEYKGTVIKEMNLEAIVRRQPYLVLVDELAHTNRPGSQNEKRYQDIEYLRDHGINVMTTVNIQHVEGVRESAERITGTRVTEMVPDWVLEKAEEVELIDVSPQVIQQRLKEGKIFPLKVVNRNTYGLFSVTKLLALRELALRYAADEVDDRLEDYRKKKGIYNQANVHERVLVCVNSPGTAERLIAVGAGTARRTMADLLVLFIQIDPKLIDGEEKYELITEFTSNASTDLFLNLTKNFGGSFVVASVSSKTEIAYGITRIIKDKKITQVVIGESGTSRLKEILYGSIITRILAEVRNVDIFVAGNRENLPYEYQHNVRQNQQDLTTPIERGKLKIYIGASAGVGKTVAMLREAHELKNKGIDVVIGAIETHNRQETVDYIGDLESIPLNTLSYRGVQMKELNIECIIERRPKVVLIDELAHTNVPVCKNEKRYQDVKDILAHGIDVISAVNVQHIESLNDLVKDVTGVHIRETVPDAVIAKADELVMIDVTPESLRARLRTGKIYASEKIEQALNSFFKKENLQALREIALKEVAQGIENDIRKRTRKKLKENVLVCVKADIKDDRIIRRGFKIAQLWKADFYALHVLDGERYSMSESQQLDLLKGLSERLGAKFDLERVQSKRQVRHVIVDYISHKKITKLILGQSARSRRKEIFQGSIVNYLLSRTNGIDILILASSKDKETKQVSTNKK